MNPLDDILKTHNAISGLNIHSEARDFIARVLILVSWGSALYTP